MNDQLAGQFRQYLQIIGTSLTTLGIVSSNQADAWITLIMTGFGLISMATSLWLAYKANTKESIAASFSQLTSTKKVETTDPEIAAAIKEADPNTEVKVATQ